MSRRGLLKSAAALGAGAMLPGVLRAQTGAGGGGGSGGAPGTLRASGRAKNVIFMVSDGMSLGALTLGDLWIRRTREGRAAIGGWWAELLERPGTRRALQRTSSLDSIVTDSAAAASAWGCGEHVNNGAVNVRPDGSQMLPILVHARQHGKRTGVVSTARVTHATPAGFYSNSPRRDYEGVIARDWMEREIDVALGGGARFFPESLLGKHPGVRVVRTSAELRAAREEKSDGRLLGLFDDDHVPFVIDRAPTVPSLVEMTAAAIERLERGNEGFVLQIEAGRIDHAAHNNDATALVAEQVEFEETIGAVLRWMEGRDDTLLVVTTDHGNANPGLTLYGEEGRKGFEALGVKRGSFDMVYDRWKLVRPAAARIDAMPGIVEDVLKIELSEVEKRMLRDVINEQQVMPFANANVWTSVLGGIMAQRTGVSFMSKNHTSDHTEFTAFGPGSEGVHGLMEITEGHRLMVEALGLGPGRMLEGMTEKFRMPTPPKPD